MLLVGLVFILNLKKKFYWKVEKCVSGSAVWVKGAIQRWKIP